MKVLLDAMGGDYSPEVTVQGAVNAKKNIPDLDITLFGDKKSILGELKKCSCSDTYFDIVHTSEVITMEDKPLAAVRTKKDSSLVVGIKALKAGDGDAFVSAGNTGALMSASLLLLGRLPSVHRPALATYLPTEKGGCILCDVGANPSPKPLDLLQNTFMAAYYAELLLKRKNPTVGLLNIGEEAFKGSHFDRNIYDLIDNTYPNFIGNIEGNQILKGKADVVITDGFVGNILLKFGESVFEYFFSQMKQHIGKNIFSKIGSLFLRQTFRDIKRDLNYEEYGGAPLLGVNGISLKTHGHSSAKAIENAIRAANTFAQNNLVENLNSRLESLGTKLDDLDIHQQKKK